MTTIVITEVQEIKMKRLTIFLLLLSYGLSAQIEEGTITYNRKTDWISIMSKLPYISQEEVDRSTLTWGKEENKGTDLTLTFKDNKSVYTYSEEQTANEWGWRRNEILLIRDYAKKTIKDLRGEMGVTFLIEDELKRTKWKILNEIKEIEGYLCMKAETTDPIKGQTIHAWFTDGITFSGGPEGFGGLPGMILEIDINEGDAVITATKVNLEAPVEKLPIPKKMKGKKISRTELDNRIEKYIAESIEGNKNPFWRLRF